MKQLRWILSAAILAAAAMAAYAAPHKGRPVEEGYLVAGAEGRIVKDPNENRWVFYPAVAITDGKGKLSAEKGVSLLPCSVLEQMVQLAGDEHSIEVRLWAMVTDCRAENYLYSLYFLPMKTPVEPSPPKPVEPEKPKAQETAEKESVLPSEILQMIEKNPIPDLKRLDELVVVTSDRNLIHRMGMIQGTEGDFSFKPDAFGQNIDEGVYHLLPCRALEEIQRNRQEALGRHRYIVSGVVTGFQGKNYFLLRRATRTFTHGNFTP